LQRGIEAPAGAEQVRFALRSVEVNGNAVYPTQQLSPIWQSRIGQTISLSDAFRFASEISKRYRDGGYILSIAIVPEQEIKDGRIKLQVVEGYIDKVIIEGKAKGLYRLQGYARKIKAERPTRSETLERYLLLVNDLGGPIARSYLKPSATPNASELYITVDTVRPQTVIGAHNRASKLIGPQRISLSTTWTDVFNLYERHNLTVLSTADTELNLVAYANELPIGTEGLKQLISFSYSHSEPDVKPTVENDAIFASYRLAYPIIRSRRLNLSVNGGLTFYEGRSDLLGRRFSEDSIRTLRIGANLDYLDPYYGLNLLEMEYSRGLDFFGSSKDRDPNLSRSGADIEFNKLTGYAARLQSLAAHWSLLFAITGQYSGDTLVPAEQFGLGGDLFLRAYNPSELLGDSGIAGKVELRYNVEYAPYAATFYLYQDAGMVSQNPRGGGSTEQSAYTTGGGIRLSRGGWLNAFFEIAKPEGRDTFDNNDKDPRFFGGASIQF
jgi:hemolysin activation/secretion protein